MARLDVRVDRAGESMKTTIQSLLVAAVLLTASAPGLTATAEPAAAHGATSVTEMLQRKHEHQLRAQLIAEGRWDEVRQLDTQHAMRMGEERENRYSKVNETLGHGSNAKGSGEGQLLNQCDPGKLHL
jgi:hypothetical protein